MKIELKKKNTPKEQGFYLFKNPEYYMPRMADIRVTHGQLEVEYSGGCYPLDRCGKDVLWSDKIDIA